MTWKVALQSINSPTLLLLLHQVDMEGALPVDKKGSLLLVLGTNRNNHRNATELAVATKQAQALMIEAAVALTHNDILINAPMVAMAMVVCPGALHVQTKTFVSVIRLDCNANDRTSFCQKKKAVITGCQMLRSQAWGMQSAKLFSAKSSVETVAKADYWLENIQCQPRELSRQLLVALPHPNEAAESMSCKCKYSNEWQILD